MCFDLPTIVSRIVEFRYLLGFVERIVRVYLPGDCVLLTLLIIAGYIVGFSTRGDCWLFCIQCLRAISVCISLIGSACHRVTAHRAIVHDEEQTVKPCDGMPCSTLYGSYPLITTPRLTTRLHQLFSHSGLNGGWEWMLLHKPPCPRILTHEQ